MGKYDSRYEECCRTKNINKVYNPSEEICCGDQVIYRRKDKCQILKDGSMKPKPLTVLDMVLEGITPEWQRCASARSTNRGVQPADCIKPEFDWEKIYAYDADYQFVY